MVKKDKLKIMAIGAGSMALLFIIAYYIFGVMVASINTHTATSQMNATVSTTSAVFSIGSTIVVVALVIVTFSVMWYVVSSAIRYQRFSKVLEFLASSLYYFCFGLIAFGIALIPITLGFFIFNYASDGSNIPQLLDMAKWVGVAIGAYFGLSAVGYVFKKKILDKRKQRQKENEEKEVVIQ